LKIDGNDYINFRNFIRRSEGDIRIVIPDDYSSVYNFTVDATGFTDGFSKVIITYMESIDSQLGILIQTSGVFIASLNIFVFC